MLRNIPFCRVMTPSRGQLWSTFSNLNVLLFTYAYSIKLLVTYRVIFNTQWDLRNNWLWAYIKSKKQDHTGVGALNYQGNSYTDSKDKANIFADYFSSVFTHEDTSHTPELDGAPLPSISPLQIHVDGVYHLLQKINIHKATGSDNLPARFLNEVAREIAPALTVIFQASLNWEPYLVSGNQLLLFQFSRKEVALIHVILDPFLSHAFVLKY